MAPVLSFVVLLFILSFQALQSAGMSFGTPQATIHREESKAYDQFILFGDSITEQSGSQQRGFAFAPALQDAYIRRLDVINRGFSGYTTPQALNILPKFLPKPSQAKIRFMFIFFGANDACLPGSPSGQFVPLDEYCEYLEAMATHPDVKAHNPHIMLITPPPVDEYQMVLKARAMGLSEPSRTAINTKRYADGCRQVGESLGIPVVDLWTAFMKEAGWEEGTPLPGSRDGPPNAVLQSLLHDGLHFFPDGYRIMMREVMKTIEEAWPDQTPENLPYILPGWEVAPKIYWKWLIKWDTCSKERADFDPQTGVGEESL